MVSSATPLPKNDFRSGVSFATPLPKNDFRSGSSSTGSLEAISSAAVDVLGISPPKNDLRSGAAGSSSEIASSEVASSEPVSSAIGACASSTGSSTVSSVVSTDGSEASSMAFICCQSEAFIASSLDCSPYADACVGRLSQCEKVMLLDPESGSSPAPVSFVFRATSSALSTGAATGASKR